MYFRARSYHKAAEHIQTIARWEKSGQFTMLVVNDWSTWISGLGSAK